MMATYFHGGSSELQGNDNNLQTLYLMNPNNYITAAYSEQAPNNNLFNPSNTAVGVGPNGLNNHPLQHHPGQHYTAGMIPLAGGGPHSDDDPAVRTVSRVHYNYLWSPPTTTVDHPSPIPNTGPEVVAQMGFCGPPSVVAQGLSLSLSPQLQLQKAAVSRVMQGGGGGGGGGIVGSKYFKAAQELLDEVVNVGGRRADKEKAKEAAVAATEDICDGQGSSGGGGGCAAEFTTTAQRQELQMKKAKLLNMLDEVEQRYRQYHTQMQVLISSFEQAAGINSAKPYTSLALKTISKQFRCLKDTIESQIKATSKSLGEEDNSNNGGSKLMKGGSGSRLRFVDHQLRQQRALQQLGMIQHNAWRPQRGLPERAVSVLRAWLFEHFLHPYPKDSDKHMLAKQTGLTRSQVSNWFINARVRLWKPMVEEMYMEEMKQSQEHNDGNSNDNNNQNTDTTNNNCGTSTKNDQTTPATHQEHHHHHHHQQTDMMSAISTSSSQGLESLMGRISPKKQQRSNNNSDIQNSPSSILSIDMDMKPPDHHHHHHHNHHGNHHGNHLGNGFNPYIVNEIGRFNPEEMAAAGHQYLSSTGVSLTLGLPQSMQMGRMGQPPSNNNGYESIDIQSRKRFAHLLHDFVG